jgi:PII-like signaling protein
MTAVHDSVMTFLMHKGISGTTATRAFSGFGSRQMLHTPEIEV